MKIAIVVLCMMIIACTGVNTYQSLNNGPRAKINFTSPYLEDRFMSLDRLSLLVLEPNEQCAFTVLGNIPMSNEDESKHKYVHANKRVYFRVKQQNNEFMGASSYQQTGFSFVPKNGGEYTIEHIDNPARLRIKYYQHDSNDNKHEIKVQKLDACKMSETE